MQTFRLKGVWADLIALAGGLSLADVERLPPLSLPVESFPALVCGLPNRVG